MAKRRILQFDPKVFIYQIYLGNDLLNITYPVNWGIISLARNIYWFISNRLRVVAYINYRLGQIRALRSENYKEYSPPQSFYNNNDKFSVEKYTERELIYNIADPNFINNTILVEGERKKDFNTLIVKLAKILTFLPMDCKKIVVIVPHVAQLNKLHLSRSIKLGAILSEPDMILNIEYPFFKQLSEQLPDFLVLNTLIPFRNAEAKGINVYHTNDGHLNINGQKILADYISLYLKDLTR